MISAPLVSSKSILATSKARKQANGSTRYTAIVRVRCGTTVKRRESRTFTHRTAALSWARHREVALEDPAELVRMRVSTPTLAEMIRWYSDTFAGRAVRRAPIHAMWKAESRRCRSSRRGESALQAAVVRPPCASIPSRRSTGTVRRILNLSAGAPCVLHLTDRDGSIRTSVLSRWT
jgi:hypothetical protein